MWVCGWVGWGWPGPQMTPPPPGSLSNGLPTWARRRSKCINTSKSGGKHALPVMLIIFDGQDVIQSHFGNQTFHAPRLKPRSWVQTPVSPARGKDKGAPLRGQCRRACLDGAEFKG